MISDELSGFIELLERGYGNFQTLTDCILQRYLFLEFLKFSIFSKLLNFKSLKKSSK